MDCELPVHKSMVRLFIADGKNHLVESVVLILPFIEKNSSRQVHIFLVVSSARQASSYTTCFLSLAQPAPVCDASVLERSAEGVHATSQATSALPRGNLETKASRGTSGVLKTLRVVCWRGQKERGIGRVRGYGKGS